MRKPLNIAIVFLLMWALASCANDVTFNKKYWNSKHLDWQWDENRYDMAINLVESQQLIHQDATTVKKLLGIPYSCTAANWKYLIYEEYVWNDVDPVAIYYLLVSYNEDGHVKKVSIIK